MVPEFLTDEPGGDGLEIIDESGWRGARRQLQQQMHVIRLTVELQNRATPLFGRGASEVQ